MIPANAPVSTLSDTTRNAPASRPARADHWSERIDPTTGKKYFVTVRVPYINSETRARMRAAGADRTWDAFWRLVFRQQAKGRTAAIKANAWRNATLDDVGVSGLAREAGVSPSTTRRHLRVLVEEIGIFMVGIPRVSITRDDSPRGTKDENGRPIRGRITGKKGGRQAPVRIWFQPDERHTIPDARTKRTARSYGARCAMAGGDGASLMAHGAPASTQGSFKTTTPAPDTDGVGAVVASGQEAGLTAGEAGRLPPADAGGLTAAVTEGEARETPPRPHWPAPTDPPHVPKPAPRQPRPRRQDDAVEPQRKTAAEAAAEWHRRDPAKERMIDEYQRARAARRAAKGTEDTGEADRPAETPTGGQDDAVAAPPPDADSTYLDSLVRGRRRGDAAAVRDGYRDRYHRERAAVRS